MRSNPFNHPQSPIVHLYQKSKSKSQSNHFPLRNRSRSYREFQVKTITSALDQQHVIRRAAGGQKQKEIKRERQISKYYGLQALRFQPNISPSNPPPQLAKKIKQTDCPSTRRNSNRNSEQMSTLLNIHPTTVNCINSQRTMMSYESNYHINRQIKDSQKTISSFNSITKPKSSQSSERRISFFSELNNNPYQEGNQYRKSRFVNDKKGKIDRVKEEHYDQDYMLNGDAKQMSYMYYA